MFPPPKAFGLPPPPPTAYFNNYQTKSRTNRNTKNTLRYRLRHDEVSLVAAGSITLWIAAKCR